MKYLITIVLIYPFVIKAQIGGQAGYQVLNLTTNARTAALGGTTISLADGDISQISENPAILDSVRANDIFFNINPYFADVTVFTGAYAFTMKNWGTFSVELRAVGYGDFVMTDPSGLAIGEFQAQDYQFTIGKSHRLGPFALGANVAVVHSSIESYGSTAIVGNIGGVFSVNNHWTVAMSIQNIGGRVSDFTNLGRPDIPFDVKLGTSFKLKHMPVRFTLTTTNLVNENFVSNETQGFVGGADKVLRRVNIGAELLLHKNVQFLIGYSHKRKRELKLDTTGGGAGISWGLMLKIKRLQMRFSRATYHVAGGSSFISLQSNLNDFKRVL